MLVKYFAIAFLERKIWVPISTQLNSIYLNIALSAPSSPFVPRTPPSSPDGFVPAAQVRLDVISSISEIANSGNAAQNSTHKIITNTCSPPHTCFSHSQDSGNAASPMGHAASAPNMTELTGFVPKQTKRSGNGSLNPHIGLIGAVSKVGPPSQLAQPSIVQSPAISKNGVAQSTLYSSVVVGQDDLQFQPQRSETHGRNRSNRLTKNTNNHVAATPVLSYESLPLSVNQHHPDPKQTAIKSEPKTTSKMVSPPLPFYPHHSELQQPYYQQQMPV